jgi:hypothetical protein
LRFTHIGTYSGKCLVVIRQRLVLWDFVDFCGVTCLGALSLTRKEDKALRFGNEKALLRGLFGFWEAGLCAG